MCEVQLGSSALCLPPVPPVPPTPFVLDQDGAQELDTRWQSCLFISFHKNLCYIKYEGRPGIKSHGVSDRFTQTQIIQHGQGLSGSRPGNYQLRRNVKWEEIIEKDLKELKLPDSVFLSYRSPSTRRRTSRAALMSA